MCRKGHSPLPLAYRRQMARLMQLHKELHPQRIASRYGVTDELVRQVWRMYLLQEMAPLDEALQVFYGGNHEGGDNGSV